MIVTAQKNVSKCRNMMSVYLSLDSAFHINIQRSYREKSIAEEARLPILYTSCRFNRPECNAITRHVPFE